MHRIRVIASAILGAWRKYTGQGKDLANTQYGAGEHANGCKTFKADAAITTKYCVMKIGSDEDHVAASAATSDCPVGICNSEPDAAEEYVNVKLFGAYPGTMLCSAGGTITQGDFVMSTGNGTVRTLITTTGTWYIIGRALHGAASGETIEIAHCLPTQRVVA